MTNPLVNAAAPGVPSFYPHTNPPAGTALPAADWPKNDKLPLLFTPLSIRGQTFKHRIWTAPMCQYSCAQEGDRMGELTDWHLVHLGSFAARGASLVMVEATGVLPNGRISPNCPGLWSDSQVPKLKQVFDFIHSQGAKAAIQLAHAGRKGSTLAPWLDSSTMSPNVETHTATVGEAGGWEDVWAPSAIPFAKGYPQPVEMTLADIGEFKQAFVAATKRAVAAGADLVEIHSAHGYLLTQFLSPLSNKRTDHYGGSLDNRMRLALETIELVRTALPNETLLALRISGTEWHPEGERSSSGEWISWGIEQSKLYVAEAIKRGVDLVDVSSGGNDVNQKISVGPGYQVHLAREIRHSLGPENKIPISAVGMITNGTQAEEILQKGDADVITIARELLRDADTVFNWAYELGTVVNVPVQYQRAHTRMMKKD